MAKLSFNELNLNNAFLFAAALQDAETCQIILEIILGHPVPKVTVNTEHAVMFSSDLRSIRLDVYASDETQVGYNLEMQNETADSLAKRSRFYQSEMDVFALKPGETFAKLRPSYVIFICTFDPFGRDRYRYTFQNLCMEEGFSLNDGTHKIFLNTKGKNDHEVPKLLADFLHYVENTTDTYVENVNDDQIDRLHDKIRALKESREWRARYMTMEELIQKAETRGKEAGRLQGAGEILSLVSKMMSGGDAGLISKLENDPALLKKMQEKYGA